MFDGISPNDRMLGSMFDQAQVIGFQMSLPSGILCSKRWKFTGLFVVMSKREVIACRRSECAALTYSKLPERASPGGFPVGKQEKLAPHGSHSVARWKNSADVFVRNRIAPDNLFRINLSMPGYSFDAGKVGHPQ